MSVLGSQSLKSGLRKKKSTLTAQTAAAETACSSVVVKGQLQELEQLCSGVQVTNKRWTCRSGEGFSLLSPLTGPSSTMCGLQLDTLLLILTLSLANTSCQVLPETLRLGLFVKVLGTALIQCL